MSELPQKGQDVEQEPRAASLEVDVEALMNEVRAKVDERLRSGFYTAGEIDEIQRMELTIRERRDFGPDVDEGVAFLHANWDPTAPHPITSHRGPAGKIIVAAKRVLRRLLKPVISLALLRQTAFNGQVARMLTVALHGMQGLEQRFEDLLLRYYDLQRENRELEKRLRGMRAEMDAARPRLREPAGSGAPLATSEKLPEPGPSYAAFEDRHRGAGEVITEAQRDYLAEFAGAGPVLDGGCGRGEFLELLAGAGIEGYGVDLDDEMVARCRERGMRAERADLLEHLEKLPDSSLGGLFAAQVAEHLSTQQLYRLVRLAAAKVRPGGKILLETVNPTCLATFAGAFYLDLTHVRPVHPEALRFLLEAYGFSGVRVVFRSPFPPGAKLSEVRLFNHLRRYDTAFVNVLNDNINQLNELIYGYQDYAVIGTR